MAVSKYNEISFEILDKDNDEGISKMSSVATSIVREFYDPILGKEQNDYMIELFQSERSIKEQLESGVNYRFIYADGKSVGFFAYYPKNGYLYLSKFYVEKSSRGRGAGTKVLQYLAGEALAAGLSSIRLNVNKRNYGSIGFYEAAGFVKIRDEVNDIGNGFVMDDFVYEKTL